MKKFLFRRIIQAVVVVLIVSVLIFMGLRLLPGDPLTMLLDPQELQQYSEEELEELRSELGLDRPLPVQYFDWLSDILRGDLGESMVYETKVTDELARRVPVTLHLSLTAVIIGGVLGIPAGVISAVKRGTWLDTLLTSLANIGITIPVFWLGVMLIYLMGVYLGFLPVFGYTSPFEDFWLSTQQIIMPAFCLAIYPIAGNARLARSSMLEVLSEDYIRTAWSKGLREVVVVGKHALKNGLIPIVTMLGIMLGTLLGGTVLIESVFGIPGMGLLLVDSIFMRDYTLVQSIALVISVAVVLANLLVDISYAWLDPRIRY